MARMKEVEVSVEIDLDDFDDDELQEEMEARGFVLERKEREEKDWYDLAFFVASGQTSEALDLMQSMSGGVVNAICAMSYARMLNQARAA